MLKHEKLEKEIISLRADITKRDKMYQMILDITENDLDNMDLCRKLIKGKDVNKMSSVKQSQLLTKIKNIFGRHSANCDGDSTLLAWSKYIQD
ncbi:hypothetical protein [Paraclostridium sordellii]|uniref:hypothetical protein n=1 Tax=Paraclostridium sordellii TaxID=1505 RepID=UPI0005EA538B|nr:hypothetical protein [Paeniclostridium sordellii]CEN94315.1 Uncharacterised protein [[Clostridium] sordellii] [Paeniclostridium sordellii]CEN94661.1 Uncharacterised protein [[Clostridium] sordellii] [Paeniclostridium sordellii]